MCTHNSSGMAAVMNYAHCTVMQLPFIVLEHKALYSDRCTLSDAIENVFEEKKKRKTSTTN